MEDVIFESELGRLVGDAIAHHRAPCIGQLPFGHLGGDVGALEELLQQLAHQLCLGTSHGYSALFSQVATPSATLYKV